MARKSLAKAIVMGALVSGVLSSSIWNWDAIREIKSHFYFAFPEDRIEAVQYPEKSKNRPFNFDKMNYREAIKAVNTLDEAQFHFLDDEFNYDYKSLKNSNLKGKSFRELYNKRKGVCLDYAVCAAALLSDNNYPPLILLMRNSEKKNISHSVFLFKDKETGYFGALGDTDLFGNYSSLKELIRGLNSNLNLSFGFNPSEYFNEYAVVNLDEKFKHKEWIAGKVDLQGMIVNKWTSVCD